MEQGKGTDPRGASPERAGGGADGHPFEASKSGSGTPTAKATNLLPPPRFPVRLAWLFYGALAALAVVWRYLFDGELPWSAPGRAPLPLAVRLAAGLGVGLAGVWLSRRWEARSALGARLSAELSQAIGPVTAPMAWSLGLASGLGEELLFRGAIQPHLGWLWASALFGAVHFLPGPGLWIWTVYSFAGGLALGGLFAWTGDVVAPVTAHVVLNGLQLQWTATRPGSLSRPPSGP